MCCGLGRLKSVSNFNMMEARENHAKCIGGIRGSNNFKSCIFFSFKKRSKVVKVSFKVVR